ncbi:Nramp family divalent metal transporter [Ureibacillus aquaedulcis]|uniref:Nramp family divalent metal transporter n=1 Tax=Ureibacillus aquaedulcis TaxID=3058421 RepID=A0ABT8GMV3_9BACL|nr:Nramp family divalent metal transporter [Ureibacillus sp. BA0131]MDN4492631.1 Nramp family divalent metal transporter [Ureibacillus sp. BA0131]
MVNETITKNPVEGESAITQTINEGTNEKRSFIQKIKYAFGPGMLAILTWLGAGDLVTSAVAGADYGYGLMWILALSLILRFLIVNVMSRFQLANQQGLSILEGYGKIHPGFAMFLGIYAIIIGHLSNAYMLSGAGEVLSNIFGFNSPFLGSIIVVGLLFILIGRNYYHTIEGVMKIFLAVLTLAFVYLAFSTSPDFAGIVSGTIGFSIPQDEGAFGALLVAISIIGAVAGSISNFVHPYFLKEKGWTTPGHLKLQRNDLLFSIIVCIIINLSIWIVGAEILRPNGIRVETVGDLAAALEISLGKFGWITFYLGTFAILFASIVGKTTGYPRLITDAFYVSNKKRSEKYEGDYNKDPMTKWIMYFLLVSPIIWSIPGMPGFIQLTIAVNAFNMVGFPVIAIGLLIISNRKDLMGKYRNSWFENVCLILATVLALWSSFELLLSFI